MRWYNLATIVLAIAMLSILVLNTVTYLDSRNEMNPLKYDVPQSIVGPKTIPVGGILAISRTKCNRADVPVAAQAQGSFYRRVDEGGQFVVSSPGGSLLVLPANSCDTTVFSGPLPVDVGPGIWVRQGSDCTIDQPARWCASWYTERFTVVGN